MITRQERPARVRMACHWGHPAPAFAPRGLRRTPDPRGHPRHSTPTHGPTLPDARPPPVVTGHRPEPAGPAAPRLRPVRGRIGPGRCPPRPALPALPGSPARYLRGPLPALRPAPRAVGGMSLVQRGASTLGRGAGLARLRLPSRRLDPCAQVPGGRRPGRGPRSRAGTGDTASPRDLGTPGRTDRCHRAAAACALAPGAARLQPGGPDRHCGTARLAP